MFSKISVKGGDINPLYKFLTSKDENGVEDAGVKWNFQKFVIGKDGKYITHIAPSKEVTEADVVKTIEAALAK
jgi:glutathione peroxidase